MLDAGAIGYDLSVLAKNISTLQQHASAMPDPAAVSKVEADGDQPGEVNYTKRLKHVADLLAESVSNVRNFVARNADALNAAAAALDETDAGSNQAASEATTFIESIVDASSASSGAGGDGSRGGSRGGNSGF
jgi:hypothetical protein